MFKIVCKICNFTIERKIKGKQYWQFTKHLKKDHNLTPYEYVLKYDYNNQHPLCACGCHEKVIFKKYKFRKFIVNHQKLTTEHKQKLKQFALNQNHIFKDKNFTIDNLKSWFELYKTPDNNRQKLEKITKHDFRSLEKWWKKLNIATNQEIRELSYKHKFLWGNQGNKNGTYVTIPDDILYHIYEFLQKNKNVCTLNQIKLKFEIKSSLLVLYKRLIENFDKKIIDSLLKSGLSSKPELDFYFVLCYFFGKENVEKQFKLKRKFYDFLLFNKIIVEYDGLYWHRNKLENDKEKDEIAINSGYKMFRVKEKDSHNIDTLLKIKELINEI